MHTATGMHPVYEISALVFGVNTKWFTGILPLMEPLA